MSHGQSLRRLIVNCVTEHRAACQLKSSRFASSEYSSRPVAGINNTARHSVSRHRASLTLAGSRRHFNTLQVHTNTDPRSQRAGNIGRQAGKPSKPNAKAKNDFDERWWKNHFGVDPKARRSGESQPPGVRSTYSALAPKKKWDQDQRRGSQHGSNDRRTTAPTSIVRTREEWRIQKEALKAKFPTGWQPRKRLSPDALDGIRTLHHQDPERYTTPVLAQKFAISAEAIRRILKSSWKPSEEEEEDRRGRWERRGMRKWTEMGAKGFKPPKKWQVGLRDHDSSAVEDEGEGSSAAAAWSLLNGPELDSGERKPLTLADRIM